MKDNKSQIENQYVSTRSSSPPTSAFIDMTPFTFSCILCSAATNMPWEPSFAPWMIGHFLLLP